MPKFSGEFAMRYMVLVKANQDTQVGVMPSEQLLTENKSKQTK